MDVIDDDGNVTSRQPTREDFDAFRAKFYEALNKWPRDNSNCFLMLSLAVDALVELTLEGRSYRK